MSNIIFSMAYKVDSSALKSAEGEVQGFGSKLKGMFAGLVTAGAVAGIASFTKEIILAGEESVKSDNRLKNIASSMGIFGDSANDVTQRLIELADKQGALTGTDDDVIKGAQAKLLTFKGLASSAGDVGGAFDRATFAAQDLAAAGFGTLEGNATMLGKALQDPVKGLTALTRAGVTFTDAEKEQIKAMVEAGDTAGAQNLILKGLETQVGGTAAATASSTDKMKVGWDNLKETLGQELLPVFNSVADTVTTTIIPAISDFVAKFKEGKTPINAVVDAVKEFINFIKDNWSWISTLAVAVGGAIVAFNLYKFTIEAVKVAQIAYTAVTTGMQLVLGLLRGQTLAATAAQLGLNFAMTANPIGIVVVAVAALAAGLTYFFTQTEEGKAAWSRFTAFLKTSWESVKAGFEIAWRAMETVGKTVFNGLASTAESVINGMIGNLNGLLNAINFVLAGLKTVSGGTIDLKIPTIPKVTLPRLATGGIVMPTSGGTDVTVGEGGQAEAIIPLSQLGNVASEISSAQGARTMPVANATQINVTVNAGMGADGGTIGRKIIDEIKRYERNNGSVWVAA